MDALTTEEKLIAALTSATTLIPKNTRVIRDEMTGTSKGYAFVEMNSIQDSSQLLESVAANNVPFEVDGKGIMVSFAKNTFSTV